MNRDQDTRFGRKVENYDAQHTAGLVIGGLILGSLLGWAITGYAWPFF